MIDHLIHFYRRGSQPFRTLCTLSDEEALPVMRELYMEGAVFWERFKNPVEYLHARRQVEQWLREAFTDKGGIVHDPCPIYMIFGRSRWLETAADALTLATTAEIQVPISLFQPTDISFTYPDSMVSFLLAQEKNPAHYLPEYHGRLFVLPEICAIVEAQGLPGETWGANLPASLANYIEAQIWNRRLLLDYVQQMPVR